jgi:hypothetical protein
VDGRLGERQGRSVRDGEEKNIKEIKIFKYGPQDKQGLYISVNVN